jgi:hypothetical protein
MNATETTSEHERIMKPLGRHPRRRILTSFGRFVVLSAVLLVAISCLCLFALLK